VKYTALFLLLLSISACAEPRTIEGVTYVPYGLLSQEDKNPDIAYEPSAGNIFWSVVGFQTVVLPIYLVGWRLYQPVGKKPAIKGQKP
jgi:hypothetical protein